MDSLFHSILVNGSIPVKELPSCMATSLVDAADEKVKTAWDAYRKSQVVSMSGALLNTDGFPGTEAFMKSTKSNTVEWSPLSLSKLDHQSEESYKEQQFAMKVGVDSVDNYMDCLGADRLAKGVLYNGAPGAGKTFVLQCVGLYAIALGLNVMSTSLMAIRSVELGGLNIHQLLKLPRKKAPNLFRLAQLARECLYRRKNIELRYIIMTMDVLLLDECGQLSAQQLAVIDILLRHLRNNSYPFGGVLVLGSFDHRQLGCIDGLPFLLSHHILTDFCLVKLQKSVRASRDEDLQVRLKNKMMNCT